MAATKISVSIPESLSQFIDRYKQEQGYKSTSQVIGNLALLQEQELEAAYREAANEYDPIWDVTVGDGLSDRTW